MCRLWLPLLLCFQVCDILGFKCRSSSMVELWPVNGMCKGVGIFHQPYVTKKIHAAIDFPIILPVAADQPPYHLCSVMTHEGNVNGGHYTAFVRGHNNSWYFCDDHRAPVQVEVARLQSATVSREASMLFYDKASASQRNLTRNVFCRADL